MAVSRRVRRKKPRSSTTNYARKMSLPVCAKEKFASRPTCTTTNATSIDSSQWLPYDLFRSRAELAAHRGSGRGRGRRLLRRNASPRKRSRNRSEEHTSELQSLAYLVCRL